MADRLSLEEWVDEDEEAEFERQCQLLEEAEDEALIRYGVDRSVLLPKD